MKGVIFFVFFVCSILFCEDHYFLLKGYLNEEAVSYVRDKLHHLSDPQEGRLILHLSSSSGDLSPCLSLAQEIYDLKVKTGRSVIVYIDGKAIGPAAIFPFLADVILVPPFVAWGDIPYGVRDSMTSEQLRSAIVSLTHKNRRASTFDLLANAMIDPHYQMVYQNGQGMIEKEEKRGFDPLILNLKGMQSFALVDEVMDSQGFLKRYSYLSEERVEEMQRLSRQTFREQFKKYVSYSDLKENGVGYLSIRNKKLIDQRTYLYVKFALQHFIKKNVCVVILDLDTPGGEILSVLKIVDLLQKLDVQSRIPVVAFINEWATSSGAMLAYACRFIGVTPLSFLGAGEPEILVKKKVRVSSLRLEKVSNVLKDEFASIADFYQRNAPLAQAMVDKEMVLGLCNHAIVELHPENDAPLEDPLCDRIISKEGERLTLNGKQMIDLGVADFEVPSSLPFKQPNEGLRKENLLVFQEAALNDIPHVKLIDYKNWKVSFFTILTHPIVATFLLVGLMIGFYIEINTPGIGIPGYVSLSCLILMFLSSFASHTIHWVEVLIVCLGLFLLVLELFVIPGFGIIGVLGIILTIVGAFTLTLPEIDQLNFLEPDTLKWVGPIFLERVAWLCGGLLFAIGVIVLMARFFSNRFFRFSKGISREKEERKKVGVIEGVQEKMPEIGSFGETVTPLSPLGKVHIGDGFFDALSLAKDVEPHTPIEVVKIEGRRLIVKPIEK